MLKVDSGIPSSWNEVHPKIYIWRSTRSPKLTKDVFRNTAASAYSLARVLIGSQAERKSARVLAENYLRLLLNVTIRDRTFVYSSSSSVSGKPLFNVNPPSRHGK